MTRRWSSLLARITLAVLLLANGPVHAAAVLLRLAPCPEATRAPACRDVACCCCCGHECDVDEDADACQGDCTDPASREGATPARNGAPQQPQRELTGKPADPCSSCPCCPNRHDSPGNGCSYCVAKAPCNLSSMAVRVDILPCLGDCPAALAQFIPPAPPGEVFQPPRA